MRQVRAQRRLDQRLPAGVRPQEGGHGHLLLPVVLPVRRQRADGDARAVPQKAERAPRLLAELLGREEGARTPARQLEQQQHLLLPHAHDAQVLLRAARFLRQARRR
eukprot:CAMPEP_0179872276 /NCGR_PEP_ID=MMETSP0982-20121206/21396_1 /TAXON_ID=483367 /ORGANISM="non described non described, Strain CCMP 2436" /LENGTH=106 /DNA_ID=CAMNT_0021763249 /DNA_START=244 /DNA_END=561 /DNA_ORIENTATION=+